ncbi:MAG: phage major capsid protein, partial [bacterium]
MARIDEEDRILYSRDDMQRMGFRSLDSRSGIDQYSFLNAIRIQLDPKYRGAERELEVSQVLAEQIGREPQGVFVPLYDPYRHQRDLTVGTATAGGHLVATELLAGNFIDLLRNKMRIGELGATVLQGLVGNVAIPRQTGGATAYWVTEGNSPTEAQQAFDQVTLAPKTVGAFTDFSRKMLLQATPDIENIVRMDLAAVLVLEIDRVAINGSGTSPEPRGILNTSGIGSVAGGPNGAAPTWAHVVALENELGIDNADRGSLGYLTNSKVRNKLKTTEKAVNTGLFVWEPGARGDGMLNGYSAYVSNQAPSNLTKGTSSGICSAILFGNFADLLIGMWGALDILVDP